MIADRIPEIQQALRDAELDGWLFAAFQLNDPISLDLLGLGGDHMVTRRCYYLVPAQGEPRKLVNRLEPAMLDALPGQDRRVHHLAGASQRGRGAGRGHQAPGGAVQPLQSDPHRVAPRRRHRRPAARRRRRARFFGRAGAALRRHLDRPAARRPPPRLHRAARAGARGVQDGRREAAERRRDRRVRGAALHRRRVRAPRPLGRVGAHRRRQRAQRRSRTTSRRPTTPHRSARATSCSSICGRRKRRRGASTPTSPGWRRAARRPPTPARGVRGGGARARRRLRSHREPLPEDRGARLRGGPRRPREHRARRLRRRSSSTAPATRSASPITARAPTWTTSRPTTSAGCRR